MKPKKKDIKKWCEALRSGEYKQTKGELQNERGFCCLGVACDLFIAKEDIQFNIWNFILGAHPCSQKNSPAWLDEINEIFKEKTGKSLAILNDRLFLSFNEIADCLEAVFIYEVLD